MKKKEFVILCLRLLGIFIGVMGLSFIPHLASSLFLEHHSADLPFYLSPFIYLICGGVLLIFAPRISHFIIQFSEAEEDDIQITASENTTRIALLVLGVYLLAGSLPQLIQVSAHLFIFYNKYNEIEKHVRGPHDGWALIIGPFLKLIISTILIIGPDKVTGILAKYDKTFKKIKTSNKSVEQVPRNRG